MPNTSFMPITITLKSAKQIVYTAPPVQTNTVTVKSQEPKGLLYCLSVSHRWKKTSNNMALMSAPFYAKRIGCIQSLHYTEKSTDLPFSTAFSFLLFFFMLSLLFAFFSFFSLSTSKLKTAFRLVGDRGEFGSLSIGWSLLSFDVLRTSRRDNDMPILEFSSGTTLSPSIKRDMEPISALLLLRWRATPFANLRDSEEGTTKNSSSFRRRTCIPKTKGKR